MTERTKDNVGPASGGTRGEAVTVLVIEHRHGTDISVFRMPADAADYLTNWVMGYWGEVAGRGDAPATPPADADEAIEMYFDLHDEETYFRDVVIPIG